jgi:hypothetical protein
MAIQQLGLDGTTIAAIDPQFNAQRVSMRPVSVAGWNSIGAATGLITVVAAGGVLFSLRNTSSNMIMLRRLAVSYVQTTAFTAAQRVELGLSVARSITVAPSGGSGALTTSKHRTSLNQPNVEAIMATTAALTAGTATVDPQPIGVVGAWVAAVGTAIASTPIFSHDTGDYPLLLAASEGIRVTMLQTMGAAGVGVLYLNAEFAEVTAY